MKQRKARKKKAPPIPYRPSPHVELLTRIAGPPMHAAWVEGSKTVLGCTCGACGRYSKQHSNGFNSNKAKGLVLMSKLPLVPVEDMPDSFKDDGKGLYVYMSKEVLDDAGRTNAQDASYPKLVLWGLIEGRTDVRTTQGYYRLTDKGRAVLNNQLKIPRTIRHLHKDTMVSSSDMVSIKDVLPEYEMLMAMDAQQITYWLHEQSKKKKQQKQEQ